MVRSTVRCFRTALARAVGAVKRREGRPSPRPSATSAGAGKAGHDRLGEDRHLLLDGILRILLHLGPAAQQVGLALGFRRLSGLPLVFVIDFPTTLRTTLRTTMAAEALTNLRAIESPEAKAEFA